MDSVSKEAVLSFLGEAFRNVDHFPMLHKDDLADIGIALARFQEATRLAVAEECAAFLRGRAQECSDAAKDTPADPLWTTAAYLEGAANDLADAAAIRALQPKVAK